MHRNMHAEYKHQRSTQVQGPREEVKPLLLFVCLYDDHKPGYKALLVRMQRAMN